MKYGYTSAMLQLGRAMALDVRLTYDVNIHSTIYNIILLQPASLTSSGITVASFLVTVRLKLGSVVPSVNHRTRQMKKALNQPGLLELNSSAYA
eukprot:2924643-Pleurochrysis_carterae.AAC.8